MKTGNACGAFSVASENEGERILHDQNFELGFGEDSRFSCV